MRRRGFIQSAAALLAFPFHSVRAWGQTTTFPGAREQTLKELAATVLPESLGRKHSDEIAQQFIRWVREYRVGVAMQPGYGFTRIRYKPESPAPKYLTQLDELAKDALIPKDLATRREKITALLQTAGVKEMPNIPDGGHIASDLMTFWFHSTEAHDLAYEAKIGKDDCRGLKDSGKEPAPLRAAAATKSTGRRD